MIALGDGGEWHAYPATLGENAFLDDRLGVCPVLLTAKVVAHDTAVERRARGIVKMEPRIPGQAGREVK